jgi:hypothetical protein
MNKKQGYALQGFVKYTDVRYNYLQMNNRQAFALQLKLYDTLQLIRIY